MSLSKWLIAISAGKLTFILIILFYALSIIIMSGTGAIIMTGLMMVIIIGYGLFMFAMAVVGIIELSYQFDACKKEVLPVCIMSVIMIVASFCEMCGSSRARNKH